MSKPLAVCISDVHFSVQNLALCTISLTSAIRKAEELNVPLIIAGDLHDTKAIIRAEVLNALLTIFNSTRTKVYILVGNHDLINEKGKEHGLTYLNSELGCLIQVVDYPRTITLSDTSILLMPYQSNPLDVQRIIQDIPCDLVVMHQGVQGAFMGDYIQDRTSVSPGLFQNGKVLSGHYHRAQTISNVTYIGNPFTMSFGEANDPDKGYVILHTDGSILRIPLNLRKHVKQTFQYTNIEAIPNLRPDDLLWLTIEGPKSELHKINKDELGKRLIGHSNFKLEFKVTDVTKEPNKVIIEGDRFEQIIDETSETPTQKQYLKELYREILDDQSD